MSKSKPTKRNPWAWVPSLYYAEGIPYIVVMTVSVIMYKRMGISNTDIALYTSWLYLPWVIKPLWSPVVDILKTKRFWIVTMQLIIGAGLAGVGLTIPLPDYFKFTLIFLWLLAFSSATHDIAADGFYMIGLSQYEQAWFVGIRSTFYRIAMITGQGLLVIIAGYIESNSGLDPIEINVASIRKTEIVNTVDPSSVKIEPMEGELRLITLESNIVLSTENIDKIKADSLLQYAKEWNIKNNFYSEEKTLGNIEGNQEPSWWDKNIAGNFESFLKKYFGPEIKEESKSDLTGNVGFILFHLSQEPKDNVVMNFGRESGDNSISLIEGTRFVFNKSNWNKPAIAVIQLDPKLDMSTSTLFTGRAGNIPLSWIVTFLILGGLFIIFFIYHKFILPYPVDDKPATANQSSNIFSDFFKTFLLFFKKEKIGLILAFLLLYRFAEAQLVKLASPFLLDAQEAGGLALTTGEVGIVYGTVGIISLTLGGLLGGFVAARDGLKKWIWWMVLAINVPDLIYVFFAYALPQDFIIINIGVALEQFGYGFGFTAYMLYMIYIADGEYKTAHFAIATGFMALGMMIPGMFSGWLQEIIGYQHFFVWVCIATIPAFIVTKLIPLDPEFGKKKEEEKAK